MIYNIQNYGAVGDGVTIDTAAIQKAIDICHENGGGQVLLPAGRVYRSGSLVLKSYVELHPPGDPFVITLVKKYSVTLRDLRN